MPWASRLLASLCSLVFLPAMQGTAPAFAPASIRAFVGGFAARDVGCNMKGPLYVTTARRLPWCMPVQQHDLQVQKQGPMTQLHAVSQEVQSGGPVRNLLARARTKLFEGDIAEEELKELETLRKVYDRDAISSWGARRPVEISNRLFSCGQAFWKMNQIWQEQEGLPAEERTRGQLLRKELARLGPVAVKVGQTLSQRPDLIAEDVCEELKGLQTSNSPFPNEGKRLTHHATGNSSPDRAGGLDNH